MSDAIQYVQAGACLRSGGAPGTFGALASCTLESLQCEGTIFRSSRELLLDGPDFIGYPCLSDTVDSRVGRCRGDASYVCTSNAGACNHEDDFDPFVEDCSLLVDKSTQRKQNRTIFGECANFGDTFLTQCYWSEADCDESSDDIIWIEAGLNSRCTCEETLTGACENAGRYHCAVSELGCDRNSTFVPVANLPADVTCFLCEKLDETAIELKSREIIVSPTAKPQITMQTQTTSLPQPTLSPVRIPETAPPSGNPERAPTVSISETASPVVPSAQKPHHRHDNSGSLLHHEENEGLAILPLLLVGFLICCAISCTGCPKSEYRRAVDENKGETMPIEELD